MAKLVPVVCDGNYFPSVAALCAFYGVERFKAHSRIHRGWTPEEAVGLVARTTPGNGVKPVELDGMHYESITVAAKTLGIKPATVAARIAKG